jgi:hypothetical protein
MNYTQLNQAIQEYCQSTEASFVANIPTFIKQAEKRIYNTIQFPALKKNVIGTTTINNKYLSCPDDFLSVFSLAVIKPDGSYEFLLNKDVNFIRESFPTPTDTGIPTYYALFGPQFGLETELSFILGPTPDAAYSVELHYFFYPTSIVDGGTSWLGDNFDNVLLYGSLVEAYTYLKGEPELMTQYENKYKEAILLGKRLGDGLEKQDAYRSGQVRVPVG